MSHSLSFQNTQFDVIDYDGQPWLRGYQIGSALGYSKPDVQIAKMFSKHSDEFTDSMTTVIKYPTSGGLQDTRIFSLRGCHLLAMFSRTPIAKRFRVWVLDVLENLTSTASLPLPTITATLDERRPLDKIIKVWAGLLGGESAVYPVLQTAVNSYLGVSKRDEITKEQVKEGIAFVQERIDSIHLKQVDLMHGEVKAIPSPNAQKIKALFDEVNNKENEILQWAKILANKIGDIANPLYQDVCRSLPNPQVCLDLGVDCLHLSREIGLQKLREGMRELHISVVYLQFFSRSMNM